MAPDDPSKLGPNSAMIALAAVLAPLLAELLRRFKFPVVVLEMLLGIAIGPHCLGLVHLSGTLNSLNLLGMCFLFFMAGLEIDFFRIRGLPLKLAGQGWAVSLTVAGLGCGVLHLLGLVHAPVLIAIALSTTAIGTLMPILRDSGELESDFGTLLLAIGAAGEFGPIALISLLGAKVDTNIPQGVVLLGFAAWMALAAWLAHRVRPVALSAWIIGKMHTTSQLPVRLCVFLMVLLVFVAGLWGVDVILGAFGAGTLVGLAIRGSQSQDLVHKLDSLSFGFLIPVYFICSGVKFDVTALASGVTQVRMLVFLLLMLLIRGLPVLLLYRQLSRRDCLALGFYSATGLPLIVAISDLGLQTGRMLPENAVALVGAGMLSVILFPLAGSFLRPPVDEPDAEPG